MTVAIDNSTWTERPGSYGLDLRSQEADGHQWDLLLRTRQPGVEVELRLAATETHREDLDVRLIDLEQGVTWDPFEAPQSRYVLVSRGAEKPYRLALLAGSADFVGRGAADLVPIPRVVTLDQNRPNPFNPWTTIRFGLPTGSFVRLEIFDVRGERLRALIPGEHLPAGYHTRVWNGRDHRGQRAASGVYFYRLVTDGQVVGRKMILMQ